MNKAEIKYIIGDAARPRGSGPKIIVHVCNDIGAWGKGFVMALSRQWKKPENEYKKWSKGQYPYPFKLGIVQYVKVEQNIWVANLIGQRDIRQKNKKPPIRYAAVKMGLENVAKFANMHKASVYMPRIGCGLAGGKWEEIENIIKKTLIASSIPVTVYDLRRR